MSRVESIPDPLRIIERAPRCMTCRFADERTTSRGETTRICIHASSPKFDTAVVGSSDTCSLHTRWTLALTHEHWKHQRHRMLVRQRSPSMTLVAALAATPLSLFRAAAFMYFDCPIPKCGEHGHPCGIVAARVALEAEVREEADAEASEQLAH